MKMKRQRIPTKFFAVEASEGHDNVGHADLSTEEESLDESDSESEKTILSSHRKSSSVTRKRARTETSDSESDPEEPNSAAALETPLRAVSSGVSFVSCFSTVDSHPPTTMLTFRELLNYVRTNCFSWQSHIDHSMETIVLYRLNVDNLIPVITHSVGLRFVARENCISASSTNKRIIAKVCVDGKEMDDAFVISAIKKSEICTKEDIGQLIKHVDVERLRDELLVSSRPPSCKMSFYRPHSNSSKPKQYAQPALTALCIPGKGRCCAAETRTEFTSQPCVLLQSIRTDLHRERCRNSMLFRTSKNSESCRLTLDISSKKQPQSEESVEMYPTPDIVEMDSFPEDGNDQLSLGSSMTGSDSCVLEETDPEPVVHFWHEPADNRARLMPHELYINAWYLTYLQRNYNLKTSQRRTMSQAIHYGWDLICHMLGGPFVICQKLKNAQSDQEKVAGALLGPDIYQLVIEHVQHAFFSRKERAKEAFSSEVFTEAVNRKLLDLQSTQSQQKLVNEKVRTKSKRAASDSDSDGSDGAYGDGISKRKKEKSDGVMKDIYSKNTCKAPGRVRLSSKHPNFFIDQNKLAEIERLHGLGATTRKGIQGFAWYGYKVLEYLLGGEEQLRQSRMKFEKRQNGLCRMAGSKLLEVVKDHCHEKYPGDFQPDEKTPFNGFTYWCAIYAKHTHVRDENALNRNALASVLFVDETSDAAPQPTDLPCDLHVRYWNSPHPSRVLLHEDRKYYVDKVGIAEYQRYYGPESALGNVSFTEYTFLVLQFLVGGEELVWRHLREHKSSAMSWLSTFVNKDFLAAFCAHVVRLFPAAKLNVSKVYDSLEKSVTSKLVLVGKGKGRLPKGVVYIDGKIPEQVTLLDQHEYWRTPADDRTQLRRGHEIYVNTTFLHTAQSSHGPLSQDASSKKYAFAIMEHMLGGEDVISKSRNDYVFWQACKSMMRVDDVLALCLHAEETFHLSESLHPNKLFDYAKRRISDRRRDRSDRKQKWVAKYSLK